jgi:hypothetical protein
VRQGHGAELRLAEAAQTSEFSDQALQSLNALDGWSFYPFAIGLSTFVLASGVALVREGRFFAPLLGWAAVVVGVLGLMPIVGLFAVLLAGVWVLIISVTLFARSESVDRSWDNTDPIETAARSASHEAKTGSDRREQPSWRRHRTSSAG